MVTTTVSAPSAPKDRISRKVQDLRRAELKASNATGRSFPTRKGAKRMETERLRTAVKNPALLFGIGDDVLAALSR